MLRSLMRCSVRGLASPCVPGELALHVAYVNISSGQCPENDMKCPNSEKISPKIGDLDKKFSFETPFFHLEPPHIPPTSYRIKICPQFALLKELYI